MFRGSAFYSTSGDWATSNNLDDELRSFGITQPPTLRTNWDASVSLGGPIKRDRLWFFANVRGWANASSSNGIFANRFAGDASHWDYSADTSIESRQAEARKIYAARLTAQLTPQEPRDVLARLPAPLRRIVACEKTATAAARRATTGWHRAARSAPTRCRPKPSPATTTFPYNTTQATYSAPLNSRTLIEAGYSRFAYGYARFGMAAPDGLMDLIPVTETDQHLRAAELLVSRRLRSARLRLQRQRRAELELARSRWPTSPARTTSRSATAARSSKCTTDACRTTRSCATRSTRTPRATPRARPAALPACARSSVSYFLSPRWDQHDRTQTLGLYAQDQWTVGRLTLQGGIRYDRAWSWAPAEGNGTTETSRFNPQPISFERTVSVRGYNDITPRFGVAYDLFGNGKTALKVNGGKYLEAATGDVIYSSNNPAARIITRIGSGPAPARGWTDGNRNFVVDCDLLNPAAQDNLATGGDLCAAVGGVGLNFGNANPNTTTINPGHSRRLGRASVRLAVRRVGAARARAAAVGRGGLQPALVGQLLRHRQRPDDGGGLRDLLDSDSAAREPAGRG